MHIRDVITSLLELRVARFLISGGMSASTNLVVLFALTHWYGLWYIYSSIIALSAATVVSFVLQKLWTFRNFGTEVHIQFPMHVTLALGNIAVNTAALYILVENFGVWYLFAQVLSGAGLACVNYLTYKHFIFVERNTVSS